MSYYSRTESLLGKYNQLKVSIQNKEIEIKEADYEAIKSIDLEYLGGGGAGGSSTESAAIQLADKRTKLEREIATTKSIIERLDRGLSTLGDAEKIIIEMKYIKRKKWWEIAYQVKYNERWCKELRRRAIEDIAISIYGEVAMKKESTISAPKQNN